MIEQAQFCFYCGCMLAKRHEHDHFGLAKRNGGKVTVCACINCHELKDRSRLARWDATEAIVAFTGLWEKASANERILIAKMLDMGSDAYSIMIKANNGKPPEDVEEEE